VDLSRVNCRLLIQCLLLLITVSGCGDSETETATTADQSATAIESASIKPGERPVPAADLQPNTDIQKTDQTRRQDEVWEDEDGNRFIGRVPYDVFFDHPLSVASNEQPVGGMQVATTNSTPIREQVPPTESTVSVTALPVETSPSANGWPSVFPATALESEVKTIRNFLNRKLQSVGNYNSAVTMICAAGWNCSGAPRQRVVERRCTVHPRSCCKDERQRSAARAKRSTAIAGTIRESGRFTESLATIRSSETGSGNDTV